MRPVRTMAVAALTRLTAPNSNTLITKFCIVPRSRSSPTGKMLRKH
jgi:hypothetical protein